MTQTPDIHTIKFGDGNTDCGNITDSFNTTVYKSDKDAVIMRWLSPLEPENRHDGVRTKRFEGVGNWLLKTRKFREWRRGGGGADQAALFCSGNPGAGKTYLSSMVIDSLCDQAREEDLTVAWLYCDHKAQREQTVINMMGAILKRLMGSEIPKDIRKAFEEGRRPLLADLMRRMRITIASLPQVFICIDALDEFLPDDLPELLESLRDIVRESPGTRIFLTGRPYVQEDIREYFATAVVIPITPKTEDIKNYLNMRLDKDNKRRQMKEEFRAEIVRTILEKMSDIFLLASLIIDAILREKTISQRKKKLAEMARGNGLSDAYTATLRQLKPEEGDEPELGLKALMWVSYSERPLRVEELCHALAVEIGSEDPDSENVPTLQTLLASCLGLVTVEASSSTVRLVHFTLQEHLSSDPALQSSHSIISEICLTYLNFRSIWDLPPTLDSPPSTMPLLEYASCCWGEHARRGMKENVKALALKLLDRFDEHISAQLLLWRYNQGGNYVPYFDTTRGLEGFTGLHGVAFLGIVDIVSPVLEMKKWNVNAADKSGGTALTWAAQRGHEEVVKALLERENVNPDHADTFYDRTPLALAAQNGHEVVVKMLLELEDVNPDHVDNEYGRTPLALAAENGHEGVVKMLLELEDVNPDHADTDYGRTPLALAAENGHEGIVKTLLELEDVNPDHADTFYGRTPLSWAAENGHEEILNILLELEDVNPDHADTDGKTPLSWAAGSGSEGVLKMLLELEDVNPDHADTYYGRTPLSWAAENGHEGIVKTLLELEDVNPDHADTYYGRTPLSWAAANGHEGIVKTLLELEDVNPDHADTDGKTPFSLAAENEREGVLKMLLELEGINLDHADTLCGRTPLSWAAWYGHNGVVEMLLGQEEVNPDHADTQCGRTPLSLAAENGREEVIKMLLERKDVNLNHADTKYGRTPLSWAAGNGHEGVVKMLLNRGEINPHQADTQCGQTPPVFATVQSVRLRERTGRTMARSPSFWGCWDGLRPGE